MLSSMIGSVGSFLGMNEADRIQKTLSILDAAPDDVPTAKLMMSIVDTFVARQTRRPRSRLPADVELHRVTHAILGDLTLEDLKVSLYPAKNERFTGTADDERRRLFQILKQRIDDIQLAATGDIDRMQYLTTSQGMALPRTSSIGASLDELTQPAQTAGLALIIEDLVSRTRTDMKSFMSKSQGEISRE